LSSCGKSIAKVLLMGSVGVWLDLEQAFADITTMGAGGLESATLRGRQPVRDGVHRDGRARLMVIAGVDVPWQMFQRFKRLAMSKQDLKDEHKESEGSPELKGHIRRRQMAVLSGSVRKAVSEATVVLMNPTHFAVALRYQPGKDFAPIVVARGCRRHRVRDQGSRRDQQRAGAAISGARPRDLLYLARGAGGGRGALHRRRHDPRLPLSRRAPHVRPERAAGYRPAGSPCSSTRRARRRVSGIALFPSRTRQ
jgi:hypothetical protein